MEMNGTNQWQMLAAFEIGRDSEEEMDGMGGQRWSDATEC
jgi:hypothetical protein